MSGQGTEFNELQQRWLDQATDHLDQLPQVQAWAPAMSVVGPEGQIVLSKPWQSPLNVGGNLNLKSLAQWGLAAGELHPGTNIISTEALEEMSDAAQVFGDVSPTHHANLWRAHILAEVLSGAEEYELAGFSWQPSIVIIDDLMGEIRDAGDAFLRLMMQSARLVMNQGGAHLLSEDEGHPLNIPVVRGTPGEFFGAIPHIAWNNVMPVPVEHREQAEAESMVELGVELSVTHTDYTPHMHHWLSPSGVRIVGGDVRLGCWAGEGTTFMPTGYGNCNSVILGRRDKGSMIEGRLTGGAICGYDAEVGGSFSFLGGITGNSKPTRVGDRFLGGAQGGVGIDLGDDCRIAAGCYVTASSVCVVGEADDIVLAGDVDGHSGMTFVPNVRSGIDAQYRILPTRNAEQKDNSYLFAN